MTILEEKIIRKIKNNNKIVIALSNVGKKYIITHEKPTLAEDVGRMLRFQKKVEYWALKGVNLNIYQGEKIGFYGPNGVGKTTLLKLIAGINAPTQGEIKVKGRIVSLIDLEAGFHPDLTGQENIFLNGLIVGMSNKEIEEKFENIVNFAGIGDFITAPLYTYSSGMKLRLGFSVAIHADPEILLLDEAMNMGDKDFQNKTKIIFGKMLKNKTTIVMVSHLINQLNSMCTRILYISNIEQK